MQENQQRQQETCHRENDDQKDVENYQTRGPFTGVLDMSDCFSITLPSDAPRQSRRP